MPGTRTNPSSEKRKRQRRCLHTITRSKRQKTDGVSSVVTHRCCVFPDDEEEEEMIERMAGKRIEEAMTTVASRKCWRCGRRFVKTGWFGLDFLGCDDVKCICGEHTCNRCGRKFGWFHWCAIEDVLPWVSERNVQQAGDNARANLRNQYPWLTFKYDPRGRDYCPP